MHKINLFCFIYNHSTNIHGVTFLDFSDLLHKMQITIFRGPEFWLRLSSFPALGTYFISDMAISVHYFPVQVISDFQSFFRSKSTFPVQSCSVQWRKNQTICMGTCSDSFSPFHICSVIRWIFLFSLVQLSFRHVQLQWKVRVSPLR